MKILLDTHILIWVLENSKALSPHHKSILANTDNEKIRLILILRCYTDKI
jgi:PIN domain nuclease of toxin-antitoxin system